jgi:hypothetical protein
MADYFTGYANPVPAGAQTSMADMLNLASGVQNYQQAQQVNPLKLQEARLQLQQAQQMNPLKLQQEQLLLDQARQMNPLAVRKASAEAKVAEGTAGSKVSQAESEAARAGVQLNSEQLDNLQRQVSNASRSTLKLLNSDNSITPKIVKDHVTTAMKNAGATQAAIDQALQNIPEGASDKDLRIQLARYALNSLTTESQIDKLYPENKTIDTGAYKIPVGGGGLLAMQKASQPTGAPPFANKLSPQVFANPITGQPQVLGGGGGGGGGGGSGMPQGQPSANIQPQASGQLVQGANESPKVFSDRVAQTQNAYTGALDQYNNPRSSLGHIPTIQNINNSIMELLKDPSVNTGAIADYLANKTNKGALNPKEQELTKYLQQRIQNLTPRTDNDAASKQQAYGSFNLDKEALKEVIRNDNQWVTSQDLYAKGILHNGSNPTNPQNPNYGGVSTFSSQFASFAADPTLMRYVSLVGEKSKAKLDKEDIGALNKLLGNMSQQDKMALEQKRQQLLKLVNPRGQ